MSTRVFGEPHETGDGSTVITVTNLYDAGTAMQSATAAGVFVIRGENVTWKPADTSPRVALFGEVLGLVLGALLLLTLLRRPPWPDLSVRGLEVFTRSPLAPKHTRSCGH